MSSEKLFENVFRNHYNSLVVFLRSLGADDALSDDVVQQVFVNLWDQKDSFDWSKDPKPYLYRSARNRLFNAFRDQKSDVNLYDMEDEMESSDAADTKIEWEEFQKNINDLIDELPPRCRMVFLLSRKEGMSHKQISETLEISVKTVENQITKALKLMRARLK